MNQAETTPLAKADFATECAFLALVKDARAAGLPVGAVLGLMYLPDQAVTQQFQAACRAVLSALGAALPS